jgi:hypothetical protein
MRTRMNRYRFKKYKILKNLMTAMMVVLILPSSAIIPPSPCNIFGSKVFLGDADEGNPLNNCCIDIGFYDIGREKNVYDEQDPVYLDMDWDKIISVDDIRITPYAAFPAIIMPGSKVIRTDADISAPLMSFSNWSIAYIDLNKDNIYSLHDPLYLHDRSHGNQIVSGDIRLTSFEINSPGTRVVSYSAETNSLCINLLGINASDYVPRTAGFLFFNANGNYLNGSAVYDRPDAVYLHILNPNEGIRFVGINDLRL